MSPEQRGDFLARIRGIPSLADLMGRPAPPSPPVAPREQAPPSDISSWQGKVPISDVQFLLQGLQQAETMAGAWITAPFRPSPKEYTPLEKFGKYVGFTPMFIPGGKEYQEYLRWRQSEEEPYIPLGIPSIEQWKRWFKQKPLDATMVREPGALARGEAEGYEMARLEMGDVAEFIPWILAAAPRLGIGALEQVANMALKHTAKGATKEQAINLALKEGYKKGIIPTARVVKPITEPPTKPPKVMPEVKPPIKPEVPIIEPVVEKLTGLVSKAKPLRQELETIKSVELGKKIPEYTKKLETAKTFEEAAMARASLRGKLIPESGDIMPIADQFTPKEIAQIIQKVNTSEVFAKQPLTRGNVLDTLRALLVDGKLPTKGELENISKIFPELAEAIWAKRPFSAKAWQWFLEIANLPRAVIASGELSASLRQMVIVAPRYPGRAAVATWTGARAAWSTLWYRDYALTMDKAIHASPLAPIREQAKLYIAPLTGTVRMYKKEEAFMSSVLQRLARDWPQFSLLKKIVTAPAMPIAKLTQISEAAFITTLNKMRVDVFDKYAMLWGPKATQRELRALAEVINIGTGRGVMPRPIEGMVPILNTVMFSLRLQLARVEALAWPVTLWKYPPRVRRMVIGNIVAFLGTVASILGICELGKIGTVEKDSRSADYMKLRVGNTRLDPWGGFQQYIVLISRLLSGELKTAGKRIVDIDREDTLVRALAMKLSPAVGLVRDIFRGETFLGEELTMEAESIQQQAYERLTMMWYRDVIDAVREDGWGGGVTAAPGFLGVGVVSYPSKTFADWLTRIEEVTGKEWTTQEMIDIRPDYNEAEASWLEYFELTTPRARQLYRETNPTIEANMYFWGEITTLSTAAAQDAFMRLVRQHNLPEDAFPIRKEEEPFEVEDKTQEEVFQKLVDSVPGYIADYIWADKKAWLNRDMAHLINVLEVMEINDRPLLDTYDRATKGMEDEFRLAYRQSNPEIDVALSFWGRIQTVNSVRAWNLLILRANQLGMPHNLFPALQPFRAIEWQVWSQYPSELKEIANQITLLEKEDPYQAVVLLKQHPEILYARRLIAMLRRKMQLEELKIRGG